MKNLLYLSFLLLGVFVFGQPVYKVTEGEVALLHPNYGIVILKDNLHYRLEIKRDSYHRKQKETTLQPIEESKAKELYTNEKSILYKDIDQNYDFKKLKELSFLYTYDEIVKGEEYEIYKFCQFNQNFFALFTEHYSDSKDIDSYTRVQEVLPYMFIEFGNKKIIYTYYGDSFYLIPVKGELKVFEYGNYLPFHKTKKLKLSNKEIYEFSQHAFYDLKDDFFVVDTLANKKVQLKNVYDEVLIKQSYDSIIISPIIKCYNGKNFDVYNLRYKKLNKYPLKASKGGRGLGSMQILGKNKLKQIDWTGKQTKKPIGYGYISLPEAPRYEYHYAVEIFKKNMDFVFKVRNLPWSAMEHDKTETDTINLINTKGIKQFYFKSNISKDTVSNDREFYSYSIDNYKMRITDIIHFDYEIIHFQKEDGTFGITLLGNFFKIENNPEYFNEYNELEKLDQYQNLQFIEYKYPFYKMKKNNLYMLYPLQKEFRYKKLEDFNGNFARFTLPNG